MTGVGEVAGDVNPTHVGFKSFRIVDRNFRSFPGSVFTPSFFNNVRSASLPTSTNTTSFGIVSVSPVSVVNSLPFR